MMSFLIFLIAFGAVLGAVFMVYVPMRESIRHNAERTRKALGQRLDDMFLFIPVEHLPTVKIIAAAALAAIVFFLCINLPGASAYVAAIVAALLGYYSPELLVKWMKIRRRKAFSDQLVDGLIMLSNGLRAGFTMQQAIEMLVEEGRPPISQEFELVLRQFQLGVDLETAMVNCAERVKNDDLSLAVTAVSICRQVGGNLAEIFDRITNLIRDRKLIEGKVEAITSQGRLQAIIVSLLPWVFAFFCAKINPELMRLLWTTLPGILAAAVAMILDIAGYFWVRKLSTIKY